MAKRKEPRSTPPSGSDFSKGDYDEPDLPTEAPEEECSDFDEAELEMAPASTAPQMARLLAAHQRLEERLLLSVTEAAHAAAAGTDTHGFENIVGVGIGEKISGDQLTGVPCVTVYVVAKAPTDTIDAEALVPQEIDGVATDVVATGELHALPHKGRYRPVPGGVSVGHHRITAGTVGCLVRRGRLLYILSNNHVLANSNRAAIGDPIVQPGPYDGGRVPADVVARLSQLVPINFAGGANDVDAAIAQTSPRLVTPLNKCVGRISAAILACRRNLLVKKCGRTTQFTRGRITDCNATVRVGYGTSGTAIFRNQIVIVSLTSSPFSAGGDSGSLILSNEGNRPVGLLFAGSSSHTIANPIATVLRLLNVTIVA